MSTQPEPESREGSRWRGILYALGAGLIVLAVAIQLVPYGRDHANPPVTESVPSDSPRTAQLACGACFDCHRNETQWP